MSKLGKLESLELRNKITIAIYNEDLKILKEIVEKSKFDLATFVN
jgi:hypothetical protein